MERLGTGSGVASAAGPALFLPRILAISGLFVVRAAARKPLGDNGYRVKLGQMGDQAAPSTVDGLSGGSRSSGCPVFPSGHEESSTHGYASVSTTQSCPYQRV